MTLRRAAFWAGLGLIVVTNALALIAVRSNRDRVPESTLRLSERELKPPWNWVMTKENSGIALRFDTRVADMRPASASEILVSRYARFPGVQPSWLDDNRLSALGIDVQRLRAHGDTPWGAGPTRKEVLLVLEQDGPAFAFALTEARQVADEAAAISVANNGDQGLAKRAKEAADLAQFEEHRSSRLFIVDAGLDRDALRSRYPDRRRYAIVRGTVQPIAAAKPRDPIARVGEPIIDEVNVPHALRQPMRTLIAADANRARDKPPAPFAATVAWGQRLEPWLVDATLGQR